MANEPGKDSATKRNIGKVIFGKDDIIEYAIIALLARGHLLIEDVPGEDLTIYLKKN